MSATLAPTTWREWAEFFAAKTGFPVPSDDAPCEAAFEWLVAVTFEWCRLTRRHEVAAQHAAEICRILPYARWLEPFVQRELLRMGRSEAANTSEPAIDGPPRNLAVSTKREVSDELVQQIR